MSPTVTEPSETPSVRNSTEKIIVAAPCRKNRTPPVTRSWLIGSVCRIGRMTTQCRIAPSAATATIPPAMASTSGSPIGTCSHQIAYMPIMTSSA